MTRLLTTTSLALLTAATMSLTACRSLRGDSISAQVDQVFAEWDRPDSPGCGVAISLNGVVVYEHGYGMANLESGVRITPASVFDVCSISKQFTAMSVLLLAERGQLSLDDPIAKYFPEWVNREDHITIRHVLAHTSGLREGYGLLGFAAPSDGRENGNETMLKMLARQRSLNFSPGTEYQYNNSGYNLLASLVKRVSGQSLRTFADANIFQPLGMTHTFFNDDPTMSVSNCVVGYERRSGAFRVPDHGVPDGAVGNAGLQTTARDLLRWEQNFADARVATPALLAAMQTPITLTSGETLPSGFGLGLAQYRGLRTVGGAGLDHGYSAYVVRFPDQGLAIAVLCNLDSIDATSLANQVAAIYLADKLTAPEAHAPTTAPPKVSLSAADLTTKAGLYRHVPTEMLVQLYVQDGVLKLETGPDGGAHGLTLAPVNANRFVISGTPVEIEFVTDATGRVHELHLLGLPKPMILERVEPLALSPAELRAFVGAYYSPDIDTTYNLTASDSGLTIGPRGRPGTPLQAIFPDGFRDGINLMDVEPLTGGLVGVVKFSRDASGSVTGFTLNRVNVRGLRFDRVRAAQP